MKKKPLLKKKTPSTANHKKTLQFREVWVLVFIELILLGGIAFFGVKGFSSTVFQTVLHREGAIMSEKSNVAPANNEEADIITVSPSGLATTPTATPPEQEKLSATATTAPKVKATKQITVTTKPTAVPTAKPITAPTTPAPTSTLAPTPTPTINYLVPWPVAKNCPTTTLACIPCTSGSDCRFEPGKTHGFRGWACQNNNSGNIRNASTNMATDSKNKMITRNGGTAACGVRYDSRGGSYFVFSTYSAGYGALKAYIKAINNGEHSSYAGSGWKCGDCSIQQFFSKYAPYSYVTYASAVGTEIGEPVTQTLRYVVTNGKLDAFATAIQRHEGFFTR